MDYPLNLYDMQALLPGVRVILYPELKDVRDIDDLLGPTGKVVILFLTTGISTGHWIAVYRRGDTVGFFDSYGLKPDAQRGWLSHSQQVKLHQDKDLLRGLFDRELRTGSNITFSPYQFQDAHDESETCGRHVALRLHQSHLTDPQYRVWLEGKGTAVGANTFDEAVVKLTQPLIGK